MPVKIILHIPDGVFFDDGKENGYCFVCRVSISSKPVKREHVSGRKHNSKLKEKFGSRDGTTSSECKDMMGCVVCKVPLQGDREVQEHLSLNHREYMEPNLSLSHREYMEPNLCQTLEMKEAAHQTFVKTVDTGSFAEREVTNNLSAVTPKMVAGASATVGLQGPTDFPGSPSPGAQCKPVPLTAQVSQQKMAGAECKAFQAEVVKHINMKDGRPSPGSVTPTSCGQIHAQSGWQTSPTDKAAVDDLNDQLKALQFGELGLNIPLSSDDNMEQFPRTGPPPEPREPLLSCKICSMTFSGPQSSKDHFRSESHHQKVYVADLVCFGKFKRDETTGALKGNVDGRDQYICDLCFCLTNSPVSYNQHVKSSQHRIKLL